MRLLLEVNDVSPAVPADGWDVGHLANLGILLSCDGFSARFDEYNLNLMFDAAEALEPGEVRDHEGRIIDVVPQDDGIVIKVRDDLEYPYGLLIDLGTLKEMGIEQYEEEVEDEFDPTSEFDPIGSGVTVAPDNELDTLASLEEGLKRAYRRTGKKIKRGFRVTSGFRKGRVVASPKSAFKPRAKASTRMKLKVAARRKKIVRILKAKRTRMKPTSQRLVRMNQRIK